MTQLGLDLVSRTRARRTDPVTSHEAAARSGALAERHYAIIMDCLRATSSPATYEQIANAVGLEKHAIGRRLIELQRKGLIQEVGEAMLSTGRNGRTWRAV